MNHSKLLQLLSDKLGEGRVISLIHKILRAPIQEDDMMIFCRSKKAAERTLERLKPYIEGKLFLKINEQKTKICRVTDPDLKFLGFGFWRSRNGAEVRACLHQKSKAKCRQRLRAITSCSRGQSLEEFRRELRAFVRGWGNYFKTSSMSQFVRETDEWCTDESDRFTGNSGRKSGRSMRH